ncbi:MAG: TldD/PmbA family protein [Candidatus Thorarchaeota archaeon]
MTDFLKNLVDLAIDYGKGKTDSIIARVSKTKNAQVRFSQSKIDISKTWDALQLELFVVVASQKTGVSEISISGEDDVKRAIDGVVKFTGILPDSMFFAGIEENTHKYTKLSENYDEGIDSFVEESPEIINSVIDQALNEGAKRAAGALMTTKVHSFFRSSMGPEGDSRKTTFDLNIRALQDELDYSGQGLVCGTKPSESEKGLLEAGAKAGRLSKEAIGAVQGEPGKYDLVLNPTVGANVIGGVPVLANPIYIMMGLSPLGDRTGEQIAPANLTVTEDSLFEGGLNSTPFDWEGTPSRETEIIEKGVYKSMLHNTSTAKMYETESTGSSRLAEIGRGAKMLLPDASNIVFNNGDYSLEELLDTKRPTIYVTSNWYSRAQNYQTGEFSTIPRDAMFLIEKGERKPIKNMRISDNVMRMLANIDAIGNDRMQVYWWEVVTPTVIPSLRIRDCQMTAATQ